MFDSSFRTTGDDALAVWASKYVKDQTADVGRNNAFLNNTIALPWRANGIAIYGGSGNRAENNIISDTANYPGIMLATDHDPLPFSGETVLADNALYRTGGAFWGEAQFFGAITLFAQNLPIPGVTIRDTEIHGSTYDGIQFKGGGGEIPDVQITNVRIDRSNNGAGILAQASARGSARLTNVTITNSAKGTSCASRARSSSSAKCLITTSCRVSPGRRWCHMSRVVVGFDGSDQARRAVMWGAEEASRSGSALHVVQAVRAPLPEPMFTPMSMPVPEFVTEETMTRSAQDHLVELARDVRQGWPELEVETRVRLGRPVDVLGDESGELLVLGSSGRTGIAELFLGSTAAELVSLGGRPVVVTRTGPLDGRVVVGVDGSDTSADAITFAFDFASRHGREVLAIYAWNDVAWAELPEQDWDHVRVDLAKVLEEQLAPYRSRHPEVHVAQEVAFDVPARALLQAAEGAALVAVGSHGRGAVKRAILGSVSHAVLHHAPCPVAVVHRR